MVCSCDCEFTGIATAIARINTEMYLASIWLNLVLSPPHIRTPLNADRMPSACSAKSLKRRAEQRLPATEAAQIRAAYLDAQATFGAQVFLGSTVVERSEAKNHGVAHIQANQVRHAGCEAPIPRQKLAVPVSGHYRHLPAPRFIQLHELKLAAQLLFAKGPVELREVRGVAFMCL